MSDVIRIEDSNGNILDSIGGGAGSSSAGYNAVVNYWESEGEGVETFTYNEPCTGFAIVNMGDDPITFVINDLTIAVGSGEAFEDSFKPFEELTIIANSPYKAIVRGNTALSVSSGGSTSTGSQISDAVISPVMTWSSKKIDEKKADKDHKHDISEVNNLQSKLDDLESLINTKPPNAHSHTVNKITGLEDILDDKSDVNHAHYHSEIIGLDAELANKANTTHSHQISDIVFLEDELLDKANKMHIHSVNDITDIDDKILSYTNLKANASHTHNISSVTGLQEILNDKVSKTDYIDINQVNNLSVELENIKDDILSLSGSGSTSLPIDHTHEINDINGLTDALANKANFIHEHAIDDIEYLRDTLDTKADTAHNHSISDITNLSAQLASKASMTHTHSINDVSGLSSSLSNKAEKLHGHEIDDISGLRDELNNIELGVSNNHSHSIQQVDGLSDALDKLQIAIDNLNNNQVTTEDIEGLSVKVVVLEVEKEDLKERIESLENSKNIIDAGSF